MRQRWVECVVRARIDGETRALLLFLALHMSDRGTITGWTRDKLADVFDVSPRRIAERFQRAQKAELLVKAGGGYSGHPARWQALIPTRSEVVA
jgi:hypothetical protein